MSSSAYCCASWVAVCILCAGHLWQRVQIAYVAKPVASFCFVAAAMGASAHASYYGQAAIWATSLAMVGDILLLRQQRGLFMLALACFLLGHVCWTAAFLHLGFSAPLLGLALAGLMLPGGALVHWLAPHLPADLRAWVYAYLLAITLMVACAIAAAPYAARPWPQVVGAALFYLSDVCVARQAFVRPSTYNAVLGLPLYYAAQWLLVATLGFVP